MNYLFYKNESDTRAKVMLIYHDTPPQEVYAAFDGCLELDVIPQPEDQVGKKAMPYVDPSTSTFFHDYADRPLTVEEQLQDEVTKRQQQQQQIDDLTLMLGDQLLGGGGAL